MKNVTKTKTYAICSVIAAAETAGEQLTRVEILEQVHAFQTQLGLKVAPFKPTSNHCYFSPTGNGNGGEMSVVYRGLVKSAVKRGRSYLYELTAAGEKWLADVKEEAAGDLRKIV